MANFLNDARGRCLRNAGAQMCGLSPTSGTSRKPQLSLTIGRRSLFRETKAGAWTYVDRRLNCGEEFVS
jgi:hypothetical protein